MTAAITIPEARESIKPASVTDAGSEQTAAVLLGMAEELAASIDALPTTAQFYADLHARDVETFTFSAERFGDFLSIKAGRYLLDPRSREMRFRKMAATLDITGATITAEAGAPPDHSASVNYYGYFGHELDADFEFPQYAVFEQHAGRGSLQLLLVADGLPPVNHDNVNSFAPNIPVVIDRQPAPARSDCVTISGAATAKIYAPVGCGESVVDAINGALGLGYDWPMNA